MISFTKQENGITRVGYPTMIERGEHVLYVQEPSEEIRTVVSQAIKIFGHLLPIGKKIYTPQVAMLIESHSDSKDAQQLAKQLKDIRFECIFVA